VQQDKDAVLAGLTLPWSNGPVEGHVNRGIRSLNEVGMVRLNLLCSNFAYFTTAPRAWRERVRRSKHNRKIIERY
jgi:hypothetical protein